MCQALNNIVCKLLKDNERLQHPMVMDRVEKKCHKASDVKSIKAVNNERVERANAKEASLQLELQASVYRLAMPSTIEGRALSRACWRQRQQKSKLQKVLLLPVLPPLSDTPVGWVWAKLRYSNV